MYHAFGELNWYFFVLSNKDKSKKYNYKPEAVSSLSTAVFQQKLVQSLYLPLFRSLYSGLQFTGQVSYFCQWHKRLTKDFRFMLV